MKKNEIIELNGVEYTLELNRDSFVQIDRACNIAKTMETIQKNLYEYVDDKELDDDFDVNSLIINEEEIEENVAEKEKALHRLVERAFLIWLNANHHLKPSEVKELLKPYFEDEEKAEFIGGKTMQYLQECIEIRENYNNELKNLKAQTNKKN